MTPTAPQPAPLSADQIASIRDAVNRDVELDAGSVNGVLSDLLATIDALTGQLAESRTQAEAAAAREVAAREAVALFMLNNSYATGHGDTIWDLLAELDWQEKERWEKAAAREVVLMEALAIFAENADTDETTGDDETDVTEFTVGDLRYAASVWKDHSPAAQALLEEVRGLRANQRTPGAIEICPMCGTEDVATDADACMDICPIKRATNSAA